MPSVTACPPLGTPPSLAPPGTGHPAWGCPLCSCATSPAPIPAPGRSQGPRMLNEPRGPGQIPATGRFRHSRSLIPSSVCCWSQRGAGRELCIPDLPRLSSLLPRSTPAENIRLFPGSRHSGRDQLFEELAWRREGKSPDSGRLLLEHLELCTPGLLGSLLFFPWFCLHLLASSCCSRGHSWLQEFSAWRPRERLSLSAHVPAFQMEEKIPFTTFPGVSFPKAGSAPPAAPSPE